MRIANINHSPQTFFGRKAGEHQRASGLHIKGGSHTGALNIINFFRSWRERELFAEIFYHKFKSNLGAQGGQEVKLCEISRVGESKIDYGI